MPGLLETAAEFGGRLRGAFSGVWSNTIRLVRRGDGGSPVAAGAERSLFARALPRKVTITETYSYHQILSVNPAQSQGVEPPRGRVDITVPYDGDRYFTRQAVDDVSAHLAHRGDVPTTSDHLEADIGHLVLINTRDALQVDGSPLVDLHGAIPLQVPVRTPGIRHVDLLSDRWEATRRIEYVPVPLANQPYPIKVQFELYDPDDQQVAYGDTPKRGKRRSSDETAQIIRQPAFSSELWLMLTIGVVWPRRYRTLDVRIKRVALKWPTITSLEKSSLQFSLPGGRPLEMQYNPVTRALEWVDVPLTETDADSDADVDNAAEPDGRAVDKPRKRRKKSRDTQDDDAEHRDEPAGSSTTETGENAKRPADPVRAAVEEPDQDEVKDEPDDEAADESDDDPHDESEDDTDDGDLWRLTSELMTVHVQQPGQLRNAEVLSGEVEVEVGRELLSGIQARLFDACGRRTRRNVLTVRTRLRLSFDAFLEDEFERRNTSATHTMHFDEVIPDDARIDDIISALRDRGFDIVRIRPAGSGDNPEWLIRAARAKGPNEVILILVVRGRRYTTRRRAETPGWHRYTSKFESGELRITVYGQVPRNSQELTDEVNQLRDSLSTRFKHVQAQR